MNELNFFQSWLHRILILISDAAYAAEKWGQRLEQKPKKQPAIDLTYKQQDAKQRAIRSEESVEDRVTRLKLLAMQSTKVNRRTK